MSGHSTFRTEAVPTQRNDSQNIHAMLPYLWAYKGRVSAALTALIFAKLANVGVPLVLKDIVDTLTNVQPIVLPVLLLAAYGGLRLATALFNELRDVLFAKVRYGAMRQVSSQVISHLHALSLRFHLERNTGGISRDIERGTRSISSSPLV